jgi:hypothetical protein
VTDTFENVDAFADDNVIVVPLTPVTTLLGIVTPLDDVAVMPM